MTSKICRVINVLIGITLLAGLAVPGPSALVSAQGTSFPAQVNKAFVPNAISTGGVSTLTITVYNPNAFDLNLSTSPAALTDTLPAGVTFASPLNATTTCGGTISTIGTTLSLIGGTVPAKSGLVFGSCSISVDVTSLVATTHINTIPANNLQATDPTGTISVTNTTPASNNLLVNSVLAPSVIKSFAVNTRNVGVAVNMTINIRNNDLNYPLTNVGLTDTLPTNIRVASATVTKTNCGAVAVNGSTGNPLAVNDTAIVISNATIAANTTCSVVVSVVSSIAGAYLNTIPANAVTTAQNVTNNSAATAPINYQSIGTTKVFSPSTFRVGGTSTFTITLTNSTSTPLTGVAFTDTLPAGLTFSEPPAASQCGGTVTSDATSLSFSGGSIDPSPASCTITGKVTSSFTGTFTNSIPAGGLTTDQGATNITAISGNVTVYADGTGITSASKSFSPSTIGVGGTSTLTIRFTAPADTSLTGFSLTDALPIGVVVASSPSATKSANCQGGTFSPAAGATQVNYTGGTIPAGAQCTLTVVVTASDKGTYTNTISPANITNNENRNVSGNFSANLTVSGITVSKAFYPSTVNQNGISTLTITLDNANTVPLEATAFTDTLPAGLSVADPKNLVTTCGVGSVTATSGTQLITMSGGIVPARVGSVNGICTVSVDVIATTAGNKPNTLPVGSVTGTVTYPSSPAVSISNTAAANATLSVNALSINVVKAFSPLSVTGGSASVMSVTLINPTTAPLTGIGFTDTFIFDSGTGRGMSVANPPHVNVGTCGGTLTAPAGATSITYSGGFLAANASCTLSVDITMNVEGNLTNEIPANAVTTTNGARNANKAEATLSNLPGASVSKVFLQNPILSGAGNVSTLAITIQNQSNFPLTGLGLLDTLPAGMDLSGTLNTSQCNGGTVAYNSGTRQLTLTGGSLADDASCTVQVDVTAPTVGTFQNCIEAGALVNDQGAANDRACDTLTVNQGLTPPSISKNFSPNPVAADSTSVLTFTITNPNATALTGVTFTDTFPAGLIVSTPPNPTQCGGTVTTTADTVTLTGGTIAASGNCTVVVGTKSTTGGQYDNVSGNVSSTNGGTGNTASRSLVVVAHPQLVKTFVTNPITRGDVTTLQFTITNPAENTVSLTGVSFTDALPTGLQVATSPNITLSANCGAATFAPTAGSTSISFTGGTIPVAPNNVCTASVDVTAPNAGTYVNTTSTISSTNGGAGLAASDTLTVLGVGLSLEKSSTTTNYKLAGDTIVYSYKLTNTGTADLYGPFMVTDDKFGAALDCGGTSPLIPGGEITCSQNYIVTASDVGAKSVTNTAYATCDDGLGGAVTSNNSSVTVPLARITIDKTTDATGYTAVGNRIRYFYTLTNTGQANLYAPFQVSDNKISSGTPFACGSATILPPGGVITCQLSDANRYTVVAADLTNGLVTNTAFATAMDASSGGAVVTSSTDSVTVYRILAPTVAKSFSQNPMAVGQTTLLTVTLTNTNPLASLSGLAFTDTFPAGMTRVSAPASSQCGGTVTSTDTSLTLAGGSLIPGGSCNITILVTASNPGNYVNNTGNVTTSNGVTGTSASATLVVLNAPVITKSFSPDTILENGTSTITLTVRNPAANTAALTNVSFTDTFPAGLVVQNPPNSSAINCGVPVFAPTAGATSLSFSGATIAVGGTCTVSVDVTAPYGTYNNTTSAPSSDNGGTGVPSNTATLTVNQAVDLSVTKTDSRLAVDRGETTNYVIEVSNAGPSVAVNARVFDTFPSSLTNITWTCTADPGGVCTASGTGNISDTVTVPVGGRLTYLVTADVVPSASTSVVNKASVVEPVGVVDLNTANNNYTDTDQINILTLDKTSTQSSYDTLGATINYFYALLNGGTSEITGPFSVTDDKTTVICPTPAGPLSPTATVTCSSTYTILQSDLDNGTLTNNASGSAFDPDGDTVNTNTDSLTINSSQDQRLGLVKSITSGDLYVAAGDVVEYSYVLTNTGNVTLTGNGAASEFTVTDDRSTVTCPSTPTSLAPTETVTCTSTYTITAADITAQSVTNTAQGHALFGALAVNSNTDTETAHIRRGSIVGTVFLDMNSNQTMDAGESPISGVTIDIYDSTGTTLLTTLTTDASGGFSYPNQLPGNFVVVEHDLLGYVSTTSNRLTVTVTPGGTARADYGDYRATTVANSLIRGQVYTDTNLNGIRDAGEVVIPGVTVNLLDAAGTVINTTTTDANGAYRFNSLSSGVYTVQETNLPGYASSTLDHVSLTLTTGSIGIADYGDYLGAASTYDPAITKSGSPSTARIGDTVVFTITVGNNGTADALNVIVSDTMPDFLDLVNITINPDPGLTPVITGNDFTINFGTVRPSDFYTITIVTRVNVFGIPPGGSNSVTLSSSSIPDPLFNNASTSLVSIFSGSGVDMPDTGFAPDSVTLLPARPENLYSQYSDLSLEIQSIGVNSAIVGLSSKGNKWDVTWLENDLGYLEETAFPSWNGNSVITGHVYKADGTPGPFEKLNLLKYGDQVNLHIFGLNYVYEVREVVTIQPDDIGAVMRHEDTPWLTLLTCQGYDEAKGTYRSRVLVRAALIKLQ